MRRLIAYVLACLGIFLGIGFNLANVVLDTNPNYEYDTGREYTYRIEYKDKDHATGIITKETQENVQALMEKRLSLYGLSKYQIATEGSDILRVKFKQPNEREYLRVASFLNYDSDFTVTLGDPDNALAIPGAEVFSHARIGYIQDSPIPVVLIDLKDNDAIKQMENLVDEALAIHADNTNDEGNLSDKATVVIWSDYNEETDNFITGKTGENKESQAKIFMTFDPRYIWYEDAEVEHGTLALYLNIGEQDEETGMFEKHRIAQANKDALYLTNLFNASGFNDSLEDESQHFTVNLLFSSTVPPSVEPLFDYDVPINLRLSKTVIAILVGLALISLIVLFINRLAGLHILITSSLATFLSLILYNIVGIEFSSSTVIGMVVVYLLALAGGLIYHHAVKNEVYRGRSLKKANVEGAKKTNGAIINTYVVTLIISLVTYFLGGPSLEGFATFTFFGALMGFLASYLLNKALFWLLANNVRTSTNYRLIGVDQDKVSETFDRRAKSYEGRFENIYSKKPAKWLGIGAGVVAAAALITTIALSASTTPVIQRAEESGAYTRIYLTVNSDNTPISPDRAPGDTPLRPVEILGLISYEDEPLTYDSIEIERSVVSEGEGLDKIDVNKTYYIMNFNKTLTPTTTVTYDGATINLATALEEAFQASDPNAIVSVNPVSTTSATPSLNEVYLSAGISLALVGVYLLVRYGLSRGLTYVTLGLTSGLITLGLFVITRIAVTPMSLAALLLSVVVSSVYASFVFGFASREKKDYPELSHEEAAEIGIGQVATPLVFITITAIVAALNLFGLGPAQTMYVYLGFMFTVIINIIGAIYLSAPLEISFRKLFSRIPKIERKKKPKKKKNIDKRRKSAEPEEAIIIGIND